MLKKANLDIRETEPAANQQCVRLRIFWKRALSLTLVTSLKLRHLYRYRFDFLLK